MQLTQSFLDFLSRDNYARQASHRNNYWVDFSRNKLNYYISKGNDFKIIIYSEVNTNENYYVIPYTFLQNAFRDEYISRTSNGRNRWIGTIVNNKLKISICPISFDVAPFYKNSMIGYDEYLNSTSDQEILSFEEEHLSGFEGGRNKRLVSYYERNPRLRAAAIKIHGLTCKICGFNFGQTYGEYGEDYIEVHHLKPLSALVDISLIDPAKDMTVLCANCHRMIHRKKERILSIDELKSLFKS